MDPKKSAIFGGECEVLKTKERRSSTAPSPTSRVVDIDGVARKAVFGKVTVNSEAAMVALGTGMVGKLLAQGFNATEAREMADLFERGCRTTCQRAL
eukprot:gene32975-40700_t